MTPTVALGKREQMIRDGFCVIDNILTENFLQELRDESERLIAAHVQPHQARYHGQYILVSGSDNASAQKLLESASTHNALNKMGFGDSTATGGIIILTKEPSGPPLHWHQDWYHWDDPISCAPWPQHIFLKYYLTDTTPENGCLKVIPGTHCKRIAFHDKLLYGNALNNALKLDDTGFEEKHPIMFSEHPAQVDVCVKAGSLVIRDARLLHSARRNCTNTRRTMLLVWAVRENTVPDYWTEEIPEPVANRNENANYPSSQCPGKFLRR